MEKTEKEPYAHEILLKKIRTIKHYIGFVDDMMHEIFARLSPEIEPGAYEIFSKYWDKMERLEKRYWKIQFESYWWDSNIEKLTKTLENIKKSYKREMKVDFDDPEWEEKLRKRRAADLAARGIKEEE